MEIYVKKEDSILKYDNTFNKTSLSLLTKVQSNVLISILSCMKTLDDNNCYTASFTFKDIREITGMKDLYASRIKKVFDELLDTKVEFYDANTDIYIKGHLFSHYQLINNKSEVSITLTKILTNKLTPTSEKYTILQLEEYMSLSNSYSRELYRLLRQFKHTGIKFITKDELIAILQPPKSYNEYDFIRKVIMPATEENKQYFQNLTVSIKDNKLPNLIEFKFKPHIIKKQSSLGKNSINTADKELLDYVSKNGMNI